MRSKNPQRLCEVPGCGTAPSKGNVKCSVHRAQEKHDRAGSWEYIPGYRRLVDEPRFRHDPWAQNGGYSPSGDY